MDHRTILRLAGGSLAIATVCGALAAHGLSSRLSPQMLQVFDTGVRYQFYHSLGLLAIGVLQATRASRELRRSAWLLAIGIALFSGSLYALAFGAPHALGVVTPIGGAALILGWIAFVLEIRPTDR